MCVWSHGAGTFKDFIYITSANMPDRLESQWLGYRSGCGHRQTHVGGGEDGGRVYCLNNADKEWLMLMNGLAM